jgi:hypothetical protein
MDQLQSHPTLYSLLLLQEFMRSNWWQQMELLELMVRTETLTAQTVQMALTVLPGKALL